MPPDITPIVPAGATWLQTWLPLITISAGFIGVILASIITPILTGRIANANAQRAAEAVARVEKKLDTTTANTNAKLDRIDSMVDGRLTTALAKIDQLESRIEDLTGRRTPGPNV